MAPAHQVTYKIFSRVPVRIPSAVFCWLVIPVQGGILNYYMASYKNHWYWLWSLADAAVLALFTYAFVKSFHFLHKSERQQTREKEKAKGILSEAELPWGWIAWLFYSVILSSRVVILFTDVVQKLDEKDYFGPNTLKTTVAMAAFVFLLLVTTHHNAPYGSPSQSFISSISKGTTFDILDTVAILDILFIKESHIFLTFEMHRSIIAIAFINLLLPTVPLLVLSQTRFGKDDMTTPMKISHTLIYMFFINVPLFIIRFILWHVRNQNISVFLIKNVLGIVFTIKGVFELWNSEIDETDGAKVDSGEEESKSLKASIHDDSVHVEMKEKRTDNVHVYMEPPRSDELPPYEKAKEASTANTEGVSEL